MIGVHCMCHRTNLVVHTLSKMDIVGKIEDVLQSLYSYFFHSPKKSQESVKLVDIMEIGEQQNFKFIKMQWISMLLPTKRVLSKYCALVLKMHWDVNVVTQAAHNLELFYNLEVMMGLSCIMPMLEGLNELINLECFVCDFVVVVKLCQVDLYCWYNDPQNKWAPDLNIELKNLSF
jgi:hypothetical protein